MSKKTIESARDTIDGLLKAQGFERFGYATLSKPLSFDLYEDWIQKGFHASMEYLALHLELKKNPQKFRPKARSAIVVAVDYLPHPEPLDEMPRFRTAMYAQGKDYHLWLKERLESVAKGLREVFPNEEFWCFTDSGPILERDLAARAGLGWVGKNTCLIDPKEGSLFFIGEILTSFELKAEVALHPDRCGNCTRCIDVCPTNALIEPRKLDANRCISYWTIESKEIPQPEIREKIGDWYFGCDLCQTVCPWNQKAFGTDISLVKTDTSRDSVIHDFRFILTSSNGKIERRFAGTPLSRARGLQHKRNALIAASNLKLSELIPEIEKLKAHPKLAELAEWAIKKLTH